jgi:hypothetical protein
VLSILKSGVLAGKSKHASKHVRTRIAWIKERTENKDFLTAYCPTSVMISDGLTKPKTISAHEVFCEMIGVVKLLRSTNKKERAEKSVYFTHDSEILGNDYEYSTDYARLRYNRGFDMGGKIASIRRSDDVYDVSSEEEDSIVTRQL